MTAIDKDVQFETADGSSESLSADKVLLSIGRRAVSQDIGLETIGVLKQSTARSETDRHMQTSVPSVFAAGDVNGRSLLAHTAYREAEVAIARITGQSDTMRYSAIPAVIYTNPEVAGVWASLRQQAKQQGLDYNRKGDPDELLRALSRRE